MTAEPEIASAIAEGRLESPEVVEYLSLAANEADIIRMAGESPAPDALIERLLGVRVELAGRSLVEAMAKRRPVAKDIKKKVLAALAEQFLFERESESIDRIVDILAALTSERIRKLIVLVLSDESVLLPSTLQYYMEIHEESDTASLLRDLDSTDAKLRRRALHGLAVFADTREVPIERLLAVLTGDPDGWTAVAAEFAIGMMYDAHVSGEFLRLLDTAAGDAFAERITSLAGSAGDIALLSHAITHRRAAVRERALSELIRQKSDARARAAIEVACGDAVDAISERARQALEATG